MDSRSHECMLPLPLWMEEDSFILHTMLGARVRFKCSRDKIPDFRVTCKEKQSGSQVMFHISQKSMAAQPNGCKIKKVQLLLTRCSGAHSCSSTCGQWPPLPCVCAKQEHLLEQSHKKGSTLPESTSLVWFGLEWSAPSLVHHLLNHSENTLDRCRWHSLIFLTV